MFQPDLNLWAVLVATAAAYILGALWYSPLLFGKVWVRLMGWSHEQMEHHKKEAARGYLVNLVATFLTAFVLSHILYYTDSFEWKDGLEWAFWMWLGFVTTVQIGGFLWEGKKFSLYLVNTGYNLASLLLMGVILTMWQ